RSLRLSHLYSRPHIVLSCFSLPCFVSSAFRATALYSLSLHDALPICRAAAARGAARARSPRAAREDQQAPGRHAEDPGSRLERRSEEHTSELQSPDQLVCRLLLEKKKETRRIDRQDRKHHRPWQ